MNKKYVDVNFFFMCLEGVVYLHSISDFEGNKGSVVNCRAFGAQSSGNIEKNNFIGILAVWFKTLS